MSERYEVRLSPPQGTVADFWEGAWSVWDMENRRYVLIRLKTRAEAERCVAVLIDSDRRLAISTD